MPGDGNKDKNKANKKLNTADLLNNLKMQSNLAFGNTYDIEDEDDYEEEIENNIDEEVEKDNQLKINSNNDNEDDDDDEPEEELENDGDELDEELDEEFSSLDNLLEKIKEQDKKEKEKKEKKEKEKENPELNDSQNINEDNDYTKKYNTQPKDLKGTLFDFSKEEPEKDELKNNTSQKIDEIFKGIDDNLKNVLGDNIVDIDDMDNDKEKPEINPEDLDNGTDINSIEMDQSEIQYSGKDINSLEIDQPEPEPELKDFRTDLQKAEDKVNSWLNEDDEPEKTENQPNSENKEKENPNPENKEKENPNPENKEKENPNDELAKKTDELAKKVDELVSEPFKEETSKEQQEPEKQGPKPEDLEDNGKVKGAFVPVDGEKMLPKQQLNQLSDMIDDINQAHGTAYSSKGINKYLSNQFKHGQGESLEEQRNSFKGSYTSFCKEAYQNMLEKRSKMPFDKRPSLEQTLADFQKFTKQVENLSKANGWMHSETEMGPFGGLEPSEIKKMQKDAVDKEPKNTFDSVKNDIGGKVTSKSLKDFSDKFKNQIKGVPQADKESGVQGPEAAQAVSKLKALNDIHNSRGRGYRFRHPILYRREGKLLDSAMKSLEEKGYDREVINQMLKDKDIQDPAKEAHEKDVKAINDIEKKTSKQTRAFEERKEREDYLARKNIKGMRKQISVPEADNSKELVNVPKEMKSPAVSKKLDIQKTNNIQIGGGKK